MKFISFYTGHYQWDAEQLKKSLNKTGITDYSIEHLDCNGNWETNTQMKAPFILEKLKQNDAVVWTDADSRVLSYPSFFDTITTDLGVFFIKSSWTPPEYSILKGVDSYLQSGTMYFKNTPKVISMLERWIELNAQNPKQWDQWTLQVAIQESDVTITELPPEYIFIEGDNSPVYQNIKPVVLHTQASRRFKSKLR